MADRLPPFDHEAERSLLGSMMLSRVAVETAVDTVTGDDFHDTKHARLFDAMVAMFHRYDPIDSTTLAAETGIDSATLAAIRAATPASMNAGSYARLVAEKAYLRRAIAFGNDVETAAYSSDLDTVDGILRTSDDRLSAPLASVEPGVDVLELVDREYPNEWLVPGLLEKRDRVMLTGAEGGGKSTLSRQVALALAAGRHPFTFVPIAPLNVLQLDLQEKEAQSARAYRWIMGRAGVKPEAGRLSVKHRRQGMDVTSNADRRWFEGLIRQHKADLVVLGPVYKAWKGGGGLAKHSEDCVEHVQTIIDRICERYDCAFLIEAHSPHGAGGDRAEWRPYGASAWLRWPEFGVALKPETKNQVRLKHWRGARERGREWPEVLVEGTTWPWEIPGGPILAFPEDEEYA